MGLWTTIFIILGCAAAGLLLGLLIMFTYQKIKNKKLSFSKKKEDSLIAEPDNEPIIWNQDRETSESSRRDAESIVELVKNREERIPEDKEQQHVKSVSPEVVESINQSQIPVEEESEKSGQPITDEKVVTDSQQTSEIRGTGTGSAKPGISQEPDEKPQEGAPASEEQVTTQASSIPQESKQLEQELVPVDDKSETSIKSDFIKELEDNMAIAVNRGSDKLLPFLTSCWDAKHGEGEPLLAEHQRDLIQLYVDIGLANNIVWLATEIGHRSKELDDSYTTLCAGIATRIERILSQVD